MPPAQKRTTGRRPFAVVQLRRENAAGSLFHLVGFQTRLKWSEQRRVFSMIPGLERAEFVRYGAMHRNLYLNAPKVLTEGYALRDDGRVRFAGQIAGVEGYSEAAGSGLVAGIAAAAQASGRSPIRPPETTMLGALMRHTTGVTSDYQPMNANFGLLPPPPDGIRGKRLRHEALMARALADVRAYAREASEGFQ